MRREFEFFDDEIIFAELDLLPDRDNAKLVAVMEHYEASGFGNPHPAQVDAYEEGILRIRHAKNAYQGRALFYVSYKEKGFQCLTVLTIYKKEGRKVPEAVLARARERKAAHLARKNDR